MTRQVLAGPLLGICLFALVFPLQSGTIQAAQAPPGLGWLGVSISDVTEDLAERLASTFGPEAGTGVLVVEIVKGGPAEAALLRRGDVIVRVDAQPIWDVRQLQRTIRSQPVNARLTLTVLRGSSRVAVPVTVGPMPPEARAQLAGERFGFLVSDERDREGRAGQPPATGRIFVVFVDPASPAARAGLRPQDVLLRAEDQPIRGLDDFDRVMRLAGPAVSLLIERRGADAPISLTLEAPGR
jgi:serine protease Do